MLSFSVDVLRSKVGWDAERFLSGLTSIAVMSSVKITAGTFAPGRLAPSAATLRALSARITEFLVSCLVDLDTELPIVVTLESRRPAKDYVEAGNNGCGWQIYPVARFFDRFARHLWAGQKKCASRVGDSELVALIWWRQDAFILMLIFE